MRTILVACCVFALAGFAVQAASVDDVIAMAQKGEPEDKQIAAVENTPGEITVGASDVLRLREAKVPEKVIVAMLRHVAKDGKAVIAAPAVTPEKPVVSKAPVTPAPVAPIAPPVAAIPVAPAAPAVVRNPNQDGSLTIENLDDRAWSYMYEPAIQTIWIAFPGQGSVVQAHSSTTVMMHAGNYKVRFSGNQEEGFPMTVNGGERSAINVSRTSAEGVDTVNVSIFEHGDRRVSGKLVALKDAPPPQTVVERTYVEGPPVYYYNGGPYYYGPSYYGPGYYRPYYGGTQFNLGFNFGGGGHHHR